MRETNPIVKQAVLEVVDNQIKNLDPPETKQTYERLMAEGCSGAEARRLIGCVVSAEIFDVLKNDQPFDRERFIRGLNRLPRMPWEKEK